LTVTDIPYKCFGDFQQLICPKTKSSSSLWLAAPLKCSSSPDCTISLVPSHVWHVPVQFPSLITSTLLSTR
jgi:hypothetical protein